jgi:hypothetical protein
LPDFFSYPFSMQIGPKETELVGRWENIDGSVRGDFVADRINELIRVYLTPVVIENGWERLYRDPADLRLWDLTYPQGEMHGGGPPMLTLLSLEEARKKYKF